MLLEILEEALLETVRTALTEDIGSGDITAALIPADSEAAASVICRETAVVCGMAWFNAVFMELDDRIEIRWMVKDGQQAHPGQTLCTLQGPARAMLSGERTALNFLQTLSGTATLARSYADAVSGLPVRVLDTRKTLPGLRAAQKYAVRTGGCHNHRMGLYDGILIKENHIMAAGSIHRAVQEARKLNPALPVEIEVEDLGGVREALEAGADTLLLDNFDLADLEAAVTLNQGKANLEASGGIDLDNLRAIAATGVDSISTGSLTKHLHAVDLSMRFSP